MQKERKNARENKMHEDDNKHNIKEMECKIKEKNAREIKCMKEIKIKCRGG